MWEKPQTIAIIIAAVAGVAGVLGFQYGKQLAQRDRSAQVIQLPPGTTITIPSRP